MGFVPTRCFSTFNEALEADYTRGCGTQGAACISFFSTKAGDCKKLLLPPKEKDETDDEVDVKKLLSSLRIIPAHLDSRK